MVRRLTDDARAALAGAIGEAVAPIDGVYAATSALPSDAGLGFRVAAVSGAALRAATAAAWAAARTILTGVAPARRRM